jgi:hypothetical protein
MPVRRRRSRRRSWSHVGVDHVLRIEDLASKLVDLTTEEIQERRPEREPVPSSDLKRAELIRSVLERGELTVPKPGRSS